ncbi:MAG TPA: hypothetical protein VJT71_18940 [Pyrinomonadaceae bacterium]|nr:hypothetical protein [Pyrinomonadaceae bacterium]
MGVRTGREFVREALADKMGEGGDKGLIIDSDGPKAVKSFITAVAKHRHWEREQVTYPV